MENKKAKGKGKKILFGILGGLLALILVVVIAVAVIAGRNVKAMDSCVDAVLAELEKEYTVTPVDPGKYKEMTVYGIMKFHVEQYDIRNIGNLSVMRVNMGVMQMATVVITPEDRNLPLMSADFMYILSNRKAYLEFYDVVAEKDEQYLSLLDSLKEVHKDYEHLEDITTSPAWYEHLLTVTIYKGTDRKADADLQNLLVDSLHVYLEEGMAFPLLTEEERLEKQRITMEYTDGLIEKGGISTDVFKSSLGEEETKIFFDCVFFGTAGKFLDSCVIP
jgi:hypothetical protein